MQPAETEDALARLDRELIKKTVLGILECRTRGDIDAMLKFADPNIVYLVRGSREVYPIYGQRYGIKEIRRILERIAMDFENLGSKVHSVVIDGNTVAVERTATLRYRGTNVVGDVDIVNMLKFDRGLVVEISELADAAAIDRLINPPADRQDADVSELVSEGPPRR